MMMFRSPNAVMVLGLAAMCFFAVQASARGLYSCTFGTIPAKEPIGSCNIDSSSSDVAKHTCNQQLTKELNSSCGAIPLNDGLLKGSDILICVFTSTSVKLGVLDEMVMSENGQPVTMKPMPSGVYSGGYQLVYPGSFANLNAILRQGDAETEWWDVCQGPQ